MIFHYKKIYHICNNGEESKEIINNIKTHYLKLPYFIKPSLNLMNNGLIWFTNGGTINTKHCYDDYDDYFFSRFAHNIKLNEKFKSIITNVLSSKDKKIIISSTPNGQNYYYDLYKNSLLKDGHPDKNVFKTIQTYWWEVENRDAKWIEYEIKQLGSFEAFKQEHNLEFII